MDEPKFEFSSEGLLSTSQPLELKIAPSEPWRRLEFRAGPGGPTLCPYCGVYAVTETYQQSSFPGEPAEKLIGKKCHWCGGWPDKSKV